MAAMHPKAAMVLVTEVSALLAQIRRVRSEYLAALSFTAGDVRLDADTERNLGALDAVAGNLEHLIAEARKPGTGLGAKAWRLNGLRMGASTSPKVAMPATVHLKFGQQGSRCKERSR